MIGLTSILSGLGGTAIGIIQSCIERKQNNKHEIELKKLDLESQSRISNDNLQMSNNSVTVSSANVNIETEKTKQNEILRDTSYYDFVEKTSNATGESSQYFMIRLGYFITSTARPIMSYILLIGTIIDGIYTAICINDPLTTKEKSDLMIGLFEILLCATEMTLGYWFGLRGSQAISSRFQRPVMEVKKKV